MSICISDINKYCYGCGACSIECGVGAIIMELNSEGFFYPVVDSEKCNGCGRCLEVCPVLKTNYKHKKPIKGYAFIGSKELREVSSSGGAFGAIAKNVIRDGGCVCGAVFSDDYRYVEHVIIDDLKNLKALQKSKYIQSRTGTIYKNIKEILDAGRNLFFCGTPCQVAGLKSYLREEYDNLLTADLFCHAANSELAWQEFICEKGNVTEADFRDKTMYYPYSLKLNTNGEYIYEPQDECDYMQGFFTGILCRESCDKCPFPYFNRMGDITLADFWGVENILSEIDYKRGCSAILVNTEKGQNAVDRYIVKSADFICEVNTDDIVRRNSVAEHCFHNHPGRHLFFDKLGIDGFKNSYNQSQKAIYDIGLIGFWYNKNYGAALTAFALANAVKSLGYSVLMIDAPSTQFQENDHVYDANSPVRKLISQYCSISDKQKNNKNIRELNDICKAFLLGSDQIWGWHPGKYHELGAYYVLDFVNSTKKKVAYGTSFGGSEFCGDSEDISAFVFFLRRFAAVSVREKDAIELCNDNFGVKATWVVDPVFLVSANEYRIMAKRSTIDLSVNEGKFVFVYLLQPTKSKNEIIRYIAASRGLKIVAVSDLHPQYNEVYQCDEWEFEHYSTIEVADWLKLMIDADYVITDSYHGFCFSIIFRKQFIALKPRDGLNRFQTVAQITELEKRIDIGRKEELDSTCFSDIDYDQVWNKLEPEIERSRNWLAEALSREFIPKETDYLYDVMKFENWKIREDYEKKLKEARNQYFSMSCKLRKQSYITRRYIVRDYLIGRLGGKIVAIRGAGGHTDELLSILSGTDIDIRCIWDKNAKFDKYKELPVVKSITDPEISKVNAILISSWKYREEMKEDVFEEVERYKIQGIDVIDLYEELQQKGIPIDSEYFWYYWDFENAEV